MAKSNMCIGFCVYLHLNWLMFWMRGSCIPKLSCPLLARSNNMYHIIHWIYLLYWIRQQQNTSKLRKRKWLIKNTFKSTKVEQWFPLIRGFLSVNKVNKKTYYLIVGRTNLSSSWIFFAESFLKWSNIFYLSQLPIVLLDK